MVGEPRRCRQEAAGSRTSSLNRRHMGMMSWAWVCKGAETGHIGESTTGTPHVTSHTGYGAYLPWPIGSEEATRGPSRAYVGHSGPAWLTFTYKGTARHQATRNSKKHFPPSMLHVAGQGRRRGSQMTPQWHRMRPYGTPRTPAFHDTYMAERRGRESWERDEGRPPETVS